MLAAIERLMTHLAHAPLTAHEVIESLGRVTEHYPGNAFVQPDDAALRSANIVLHYGTDEPAHVELELAAPIAIADLEQAFGAYKRVMPDGKGPQQIIFYVDPPEQPCTLAVIANVEGDSSRVLMIRRDTR